MKSSEQNQVPHSTPIAQAEALCEAGDYRAAIELLVKENRKMPSAQIEQQLLNLRIKGFRLQEWPHVEWPGGHSERFSSVEGIPEIEASELCADLLRDGILGKGGLIVRGLIDANRVDDVKGWIAASVKARDNRTEAESSEIDSAWYQRSPEVEGNLVEFDRSVWTVDSPPAAFRLIELYQELGLREIMHEYFGEPAMLSVRKWVLRNVPPNNGAESGWHQDGRFMGDDLRTANLWLALTDCGEGADAPGIDIVADNTREIYPTGTHGAPFDWTVGQGLVDEIAQKHPVLRPRFHPGDAIFFDHFNLHRTGFGTADRYYRHAVESWFFAASRAPGKQQPLMF